LSYTVWHGTLNMLLYTTVSHKQYKYANKLFDILCVKEQNTCQLNNLCDCSERILLTAQTSIHLAKNFRLPPSGQKTLVPVKNRHHQKAPARNYQLEHALEPKRVHTSIKKCPQSFIEQHALNHSTVVAALDLIRM